MARRPAMNDRTEHEALERVLEEYGTSTDRPDHASLVEWIRRYPEYEQELTEFAVAWSQIEHLPAAARPRDLDTDTLVLRGMSIFQSILHRKHAERSSEEAIDSIIATSARHGLALERLADQLDLNA